MGRRPTTPKEEVIFKYWKQKDNLEKLGEANLGIKPKGCFACGNRLKGIERCHIIPFILCKNSNIDNMHLLCPVCHRESECHENYWSWIKWKRKTEYLDDMQHLKRLCAQHGIDVDSEIEEIRKNGKRAFIEMEYVTDLFKRMGREIKPIPESYFEE